MNSLTEKVIAFSPSDKKPTSIPVNIVNIARSLTPLPGGSNIYIPNVENVIDIVPKLMGARQRISAITSCTGTYNKISSLNEEEILGVMTSMPQKYRPLDTFHYGICAPRFHESIDSDGRVHIESDVIQDRMATFQCSYGKDGRFVHSHLLYIESVMMSVMAGCFFSIIVPANWAGRDMRYLRWWEENVATVATIRLPSGTILAGGEPSKGEWNIILLFKPQTSLALQPNTGTSTNLEWSKLRWPRFQFTMESLETQNVKDMLNSWKQSPWFTNTYKLLIKHLGVMKNHRYYGVSYRYKPVDLPGDEDTYLFSPHDSHRNGFLVLDSTDDISTVKNAVHVVETRSKVKLIPQDVGARDALAVATSQQGFEFISEAGKTSAVPNLRRLLSGSSLAMSSEKICEILRQHGIVPCITREQEKLMKQAERRLSIMMTPISRLVEVKKVKKKSPGTLIVRESSSLVGEIIDDPSDTDIDDDFVSQTLDEVNSGNEFEEVWEDIYRDSSVDAVYPEIIEMWKKRATAMKFDSILFGGSKGYQMRDVVMHAAKKRVLNGNPMGLGKTIETLFAMMLLGAEKVLIVCPSSLIGVWQDEIDSTIIPYARRMRKNWQGKVINATSPLIIENAADLLGELPMFSIISYDKLKSVPRDGRFFQCPVCGFVAYSPYKESMRCQSRKCADEYLIKMDEWRRSHDNKSRSLIDGKLIRQKYRVDIYTGKKVHWNENHPSRNGLKDIDTKIIDTRIPETDRPSPPQMVVKSTMYKKMMDIIIGYENKIVNGREVSVPKIKQIERPSHVAWTFSDLIRNRFKHIIVDEVLNASNEEAMRSQALYHLCATRRFAITGTPMKGKPQCIVPYLNWLLPRHAYPDYRKHVPGAMNKFLSRYETVVYKGGVEIDGEIQGGRPVQIPKINNVEMFQTEIAPFIIRHARTEPGVVEFVGRKIVRQNDITVKMDDAHRSYYQKWLDEFAEWWRIKQEEEEGKTVNQGDLLAKIAYLIGASIDPHKMLDSILDGQDPQGKAWAQKIGPYTGPPVQKMVKAISLIRSIREKGDKCIAFSTRTNVLKQGKALCDHPRIKIPSLIIDGSVSLKIQAGSNRSKRHMLVDEFRTKDICALWGGIGCLADGMNIPEANHGLFLAMPWEPKAVAQSLGRMIRPQQKKVVYQYNLMHEGTIDDFMTAVCYLKARSHGEGIDYVSFDDFSVEVIPSFQAYADAIVDGTTEVLREKMWTAVDKVKREAEREGEVLVESVE